jgi:hypothetical protein
MDLLQILTALAVHTFVVVVLLASLAGQLSVTVLAFTDGRRRLPARWVAPVTGAMWMAVGMTLARAAMQPSPRNAGMLLTNVVVALLFRRAFANQGHTRGDP